MYSSTFSRTVRCIQSTFEAASVFRHRGSRGVSTLADNPHIYVFKHPIEPNRHILSLLPTEPPTASLAIGTTTSIPPTPDTLTENHQFLGILQSVLYTYALQDPEVKQQAAVFASPGGFNLGSGAGAGAGPASKQGGIGGANKGGWLHVSDSRNPPDWGRIAWPEDIFGSLEVDGNGNFAESDGNYQPSGTYRIITREGILGLSPFLRERLVERLRELEKQQKQHS
ncbi:hypothetical protein K491DRAFT_602525 [Lophiostoma macrostomum CBS 122681]|uniref:Uncharacterized protein n=1 Tax=Lophiostoma macrostomum CBS 122681 TaxID=1314788 RepID=A0A6A6T1M6_9PLEO|nr:hypothetical protein K491DRAFT_602525 [Lophiostoma macrostomum CBS 122681]